MLYYDSVSFFSFFYSLTPDYLYLCKICGVAGYLTPSADDIKKKGIILIIEK